LFHGGIQKTSLVDYPGHICDVVFLAGCNFRCPYCHNPELVLGGEHLSSYQWADVLDGIAKRAHVLDGVCISGGEPTLHPELAQWCAQIKELGLLVKLDTNGTSPELLGQLLADDLVDYVAMDIKAPPVKYEQVTRTKVDLKSVERSVDLLLAGGISYEFRTTVPRSLLGEKDLLMIGQWINGASCYVLQRYRPEHHLDLEFESDERGSEAWLLTMQEKLKPYADSIKVRGL
jgi:pyruvate formate lyase activating enzyme